MSNDGIIRRIIRERDEAQIRLSRCQKELSATLDERAALSKTCTEQWERAEKAERERDKAMRHLKRLVEWAERHIPRQQQGASWMTPLHDAREFLAARAEERVGR